MNFKYIDKNKMSESDFINKLKTQIENDLQEIDGKYNEKIALADQELKIEYEKLKTKYDEIIVLINKTRDSEKDTYRTCIEQRIADRQENTWWNYFGLSRFIK